MKSRIYPNLTPSSRKHIREEKARIRRESADPKVREQRIAELYHKFGVTRV